MKSRHTYKKGRCAVTTVTFIWFIITGQIFLFSYQNTGPHRMINRLTLRIFWKTVETMPQFKNYIFKGDLPLITGEDVVTSGMFYEWDEIGPISFTDWIADNKRMRVASRSYKYHMWIERGGYTADEPELWQAMRHFYDPTASETKYLTDFKDWGLWLTNMIGSWVLGRAPQMDAVTWAITGPAKNGFRVNDYCWQRGVDYMRRACYTVKSSKEKERLFAAAWRALGETMHLLADMTVPAHVRNDSHPGMGWDGHYSPANYGSLKKDFYEEFLDKHTIRKSIYAQVNYRKTHMSHADMKILLDPKLCRSIDAITQADETSLKKLFHTLAVYTNKHFFSQDTFYGSFDGGKRIILPGNKMPPYLNPGLQECQKRGCYLYKPFFGGKMVCMAKESFFTLSGYEIDRRVALSQGIILIPIALYANVKLLDWYIPHVQVKLENFNSETQTLTGEIIHIPHGAHTKPLIFNQKDGWSGWLNLYINKKKIPSGTYSCQIDNNKITCNLKGIAQLNTSENSDVVLELNLGGILVRSNKLGEIEGTSWTPRGSSYNNTMATFLHRKIDNGKMTKASIIWSDYEGWDTVMTVSGEIKQWVYLKEHTDWNTRKSGWYYALILPPDMPSGKFNGKIHYYTDGGKAGIYTIPVTLTVSGRRTEGVDKMDANAITYLNHLLADLAGRIQRAEEKLAAAKAVDLNELLAENNKRKVAVTKRVEGEIKQTAQNIKGINKDTQEHQKRLGKLHLDPSLKNNPQAMHRTRTQIQELITQNKVDLVNQHKELEDKQQKLAEIPGAFKRYAREITQRYYNQIKILERYLKELKGWQKGLCKSFGKYIKHKACQGSKG